VSLLNFPTYVSVLLTIVISSTFSILLYFIIHPFWARDLTEETKKTAEQVVTRIGVVYAVVIGMMFANVRIEHVQMIQDIESEASALIRFYGAIEQDEGKGSEEVRKNLLEYIRFIVEEQWPALRAARVQPGDRHLVGSDQLNLAWDYVLRAEQETGNSNLRMLLDQVEHHRILRLFDTKGNILPLFWYIAALGYFASLVPLFVHPPSLRRSLLIALYSSLVSVALLGIFILSHPYSEAAGIEPVVYKSLLQAVGSDLNNPQ
jgi:fumarate reductase subunit D